MRKVSLLFLAACLLSIIPARIGAQELKLGYIDTVKIFGDFSETIEAEGIYKKEVEAWNKKAKEMEVELAQLREEIQSQSLMLSEDKLAEKKLVFDQKAAEYKKFVEDIFGDEGEAARRNKELTQPIVEKINAVIAQIAEEEGYTLVLDSSQGNIVYAKKDIDLTQKVIDRLKEQMESIE